MGIKSFIKNVKESFGFKIDKKLGKKKSLKTLLKKMEAKQHKLETKLPKEKNNNEKKEIQLELDVIALQIKKCEKVLKKLDS